MHYKQVSQDVVGAAKKLGDLIKDGYVPEFRVRVVGRALRDCLP